MRRIRSVTVVTVLLLAVLAGAVAAGASGGTGLAATTTQVEADQIVLRVTLHEDGSATWRIEHVVQLDDENTTQAFKSLVADIRDNRSAYVSRFRDRILSTVRAAENATGREMAVRDVNVTATYSLTQGKIVYRFEWIGFAATPGERVVAGDAISGLVLDDRTRLVFQWPEEWRVIEVSPNPDRRRPGVAVWTGPWTFATREPHLVLSTAETTPTATHSPTPTLTLSPTPTPTPPRTPTATPTAGAPGGPPGTDRRRETTTAPGTPAGGGPLGPGILLGGLLLLVGIVAWFAYRHREELPAPLGPVERGADEESAESGESEGPPEELLSNEERVLRLLEERGGRMKQQEVASELDWTDAKTSQVVGTLREEDEIEVFRIGRENVLALPEESEF